MSAKMPASTVLTKENSTKGLDAKVMPTSSTLTPCLKSSVPTTKTAVSKVVTIQPKEMSPCAPQDGDRPELLGSLTTEQQQRTSARVIKKLRLEPQPPLKRSDADEAAECETLGKIDDKELKFPTVKQRMPKALWSTDEKNLFFEALNEYGKDFDAITSYICAKMKKKGMPDSNLKTKTQVSHFYYRTWHKLSKHVHFDENVKKVAQELYALINYGELRKKLVSVNEKTCGRLGEMVLGGSMVVRTRGRNLRVRTPMCRALRRLNQITERLCGSRVCSRAAVWLRARDACAWSRVQAAAHNPRAQVSLPPRTSVAHLIHALQRRWKTAPSYKHKAADIVVERDDETPDRACEEDNHLNLELDRVIVEEQKAPKKLALHVGPRPDAEIHLPVVSPAEQLSSQKICFSSYLERMGEQNNVKIRTPKRQRKDSATEKDKEVEQKRFKTEDPRLVNIEETAIDGIELMASYKNLIEHTANEYVNTDDIKYEEEELERDKDMSEREKDSLSEMEDDEKYNKSDTDNESDGKSGKERKFKNLKVKFRIRPKKCGGSVYTLVTDDAKDDFKEEKLDIEKVDIDKPDVDKPDVDKPEVESADKPDIDVDMAMRQIRRGWSVKDAGDLTVGDLYLMFGNRSKLELDYWWAEPTSPLPPPVKLEPEKEAREKHKTDKERDSSVDDDKEEMLSPKMSADSNDGLSADERKNEHLMSPEHKSSTSTLKLVSKLINRPNGPPPNQSGFSLLSERLKRLLALCGNAHVSGRGSALKPPALRQPPPPPPPPAHSLFRHPPPIAPKTEKTKSPALDIEDLPRGRRGRSRLAERRIVVQRLLPLLPKLPPPSTLIPVKIVPDSPHALPKILPKPPPTSTSDLSFFYVLSESNGQFYFHDGDRRIPITQLPKKEENDVLEPKSEVLDVDDDDDGADDGPMEDANLNPGGGERKVERDMGCFLPSESMSLSPSRFLRDAEWPEGAVQDFSLSSFLQHLETRAPHELAVDSQLHSLMAESSVDYVAKFADLAAEVTDDDPTLTQPRHNPTRLNPTRLNPTLDGPTQLNSTLETLNPALDPLNTTLGTLNPILDRLNPTL